MNSCSAFTTTFDGISLKLLNKVKISNNDRNIEVIAQWDTGATGSCISHEVVSKLGLTPFGKQSVLTPSGEGIVDTYLVEVILPNNVMVSDLLVGDSEIGKQGIGILIGMDVISKGDFSVSNKDGKTIFTFRMPSLQVTDYVKQIAVQNKVGHKHGLKKSKHKK